MTDHDHAGFEVTDYADPLGRSVDRALLSRAVAAAFDGCTPCQETTLALLVQDPTTTARLVELACVSTQALFGGLPDSMTDQSVPGLSSPEFRRLARAGLDGANDAMFVACEEMTPAERRSAANTALDTLIGHMALGD